MITPSERSMISEFLKDGASNAEIAKSLGLATQTVKNAMSVIMEKTGVKSRAGLALWLERRINVMRTTSK